MRRLRIRTYSLLCLVLLSLLPWVFFVSILFITTHSVQLGAERQDSYRIPMIAAFAGLLLAFFVIGLKMRKQLLGPLERMGQAARQIAAGDLDVHLPPSTVKEIDEVRDGFEVMVNGLQSAYRKQAELEEERRFVIAAVAHDLRTPLFALRGYLDGLEQGIAKTPEQMAKYVAVCKEKSVQLDRLVEDLFTFTRMEYQEDELAMREASFHEIVQKSIDSLKLQSQQKHITVVTAFNDCVIQADAHLLERAMNNLLDNAVRYTPVHGRIMIEICSEGDRVAFTIHDSGQGFSQEEVNRVFEPLYRGEQSRNRATGGAGLGLTISKRIIQRHGGELTAGNHPSGGAVLSGWFPADHEEREGGGFHEA
ncbi:HAMP domain-containing sensor histidine kinase [Brevibacillus nitrificans]|uniref:sensor histidine kinase n=1 Tax=Brevibacillus nitrificans TaxID=651560 RepID=UPI00285CDD53|nr:HAMP domain-containing sensor histidine kinase [Brevibacillus nitrificans]MDR7317099.1 signal transduction histidine kinase [Brevibacillus nitrificans]